MAHGSSAWKNFSGTRGPLVPRCNEEDDPDHDQKQDEAKQAVRLRLHVDRLVAAVRGLAAEAYRGLSAGFQALLMRSLRRA
jgi:hypothetical protein